MKIQPGQVKSHGSCKRHAIQEIREMLTRMQNREDDFFCPDLGDHPELIIRSVQCEEPTTIHNGTKQLVSDC